MTDAVTLNTSQRLFSEMLDNPAADDPFIAILEKNPRIPGQVATDIYQNNTIGCRKRTLQAIYPVIEKILGVRCFDKLAHDFVVASPSFDSDLNLYGAGFSGFLLKLANTEHAFLELPYLKDLATLEWLYHKTYYSPDDLPLPASQFAGLDASISIERSRSLYSMSSLYPVYAIWQNHQGDDSVNEVPALTDEEFIIIFRQQGHPVVQQLDREEWSILQSVDAQTGLDGMVQSALVDGVDIEHKLPLMIERGWLRFCQCA
ncbi:MAG: putative DNA-binding domain-containing protein [Arenicellales bacterium]